MLPTFLISDESVNHYGYRILMEGGDLRFFLMNPVLFYNHFRNDEKCTVYGMWQKVEFSEKDGAKSLVGTPLFDKKDKEGKRLHRKVKEGFLRACSIHIRPLEVSDDPALKLEGQTGPTVTKWQLKEASIVDIPGNGESVRLSDENGEAIDPYKLSDFISTPKALTAPQSTMDDLQFLVASLGLPKGSSLSDANDAINKLKAKDQEVASLKLKLKSFEDDKAAEQMTEAKALLDAAEKDGRITTALRPVYENALKADHASGKALLESLRVVPNLKDVTPGAGAGRVDATGLVDGKYEGKTFSELSQLNDGEDLVKLKNEKPKVFAALYEKQYGKPYVTYG